MRVGVAYRFGSRPAGGVVTPSIEAPPRARSLSGGPPVRARVSAPDAWSAFAGELHLDEAERVDVGVAEMNRTSEGGRRGGPRPVGDRARSPGPRSRDRARSDGRSGGRRAVLAQDRRSEPRPPCRLGRATTAIASSVVAKNGHSRRIRRTRSTPCSRRATRALVRRRTSRAPSGATASRRRPTGSRGDLARRSGGGSALAFDDARDASRC